MTRAPPFMLHENNPDATSLPYLRNTWNLTVILGGAYVYLESCENLAFASLYIHAELARTLTGCAEC